MGSTSSLLSESFESFYSSDTESSSNHNYDPTVEDVLEVEVILRRYVPSELAVIILDEARYWVNARTRREAVLDLAAVHPKYEATECYLVTDFIPEWKGRLNHEECGERKGRTPKIRAVKFRIESSDQGWGGDPHLAGPYDGSHTWFEAAIYRRMPGVFSRLRNASVPNLIMDSITDEDARTNLAAAGITRLEDTWLVQRNLRAAQGSRIHEVVWTRGAQNTGRGEGACFEMDRTTGAGLGHGFIASLKAGDRVAIIARAQYPEWENKVKNAAVEIYYSI